MKRWPLHKADFWETAPFFRLLLPFACGILCYDQLLLWLINESYFLALIFLAFLLLAYFSYFKKGAAFFLALHAILFCFGIALSYFNDTSNENTWFAKTADNNNSYLVKITDAPAEKEHSWKLAVQHISTIRDGKVIPVTGKAFVYVYKDQLPMNFHKGDSILLPGNWQPIRNAGNPFEFDYAAYCRRNNIVYQQTCGVNNIRLYGAYDADAATATERAHNWCMQQLDNYITNGKTKGLIQAMLLGDEINLDEELRQSFSETGIIHIIAISGGNVAIFFIVISALLLWVKNRKYLWIKYAIALPMVWFYIVMAGAPPSAVRAALMFTLVALAVMFQKNNNSLNTLFATAFLLLCSQPMWLFSIGFQLSFVAVLSLILFYAPVYKWLSPKYKIIKWFWGAVAASIAAEILVAPIVIYYFHTFPLLFIVANVAAYFFMGLVLIGSIALITISWLPIVARGLGITITWLVIVFDHIVKWLQGFNPHSFHYLMLTGTELILLYTVIAGVLVFVLRRQKTRLFVGLGAGCLLFIFFCADEWNRLHQERLVVYNTGKANHIELIKGNTFTVLQTDTSAVKKTGYAAKPAHINWRAWEEGTAVKNEVFIVGGSTVLLLNKDINANGHFPVDYLVVNYAGTPDAIKLKSIFSPKQIIIGNNYSKKQLEQFIKDCEKAGSAIHATSKDGAFILPL